MHINTLVTYVNELLAGENLTSGELLIHFDSVIDDINAALDSVYPALSEFDMARYPGRYPNYDFFPDKYQRTVLVSGAAFRFYITDEEGGYVAPQYERRYQQALFEMKRDYIGQVPEIYRAAQQGYMKDSEAPRGLWLRPGGSLEELPPTDVVNPDLRIYEGQRGAEGKQGIPGRGIQNMRITADRKIIARYTDQTEEVIGSVDVLVTGPAGPRGVPGKAGPIGEQGEQGVAGRSITAMWTDDANQIWLTYDRDLSPEIRAGQPYRIGQLNAKAVDAFAREQIDLLRQAVDADLAARTDIRTTYDNPNTGTIVFYIEEF